jgi:hypothetical protein
MQKYNEKQFAENTRIYWTIVSNLHYCDDGFYILKNTPYIGIIKYNFEGVKISELWAERSVDYMPNDFYLKRNSDVLLLIKSPEAKIEVYRPLSGGPTYRTAANSNGR